MKADLAPFFFIGDVMSFVHSDLLDDTQFTKMEDWFKQRTGKHIALVQEFGNDVAKMYPEYADILQNNLSQHDETKYQSPEYEPYVWLTWQYKCKAEGNDFSLSEDIQQKIHDVTFHHVRNNSHHPEFWDKNLKTNPISYEDRDKPSGIVVCAKKMEIPSVLEMCCDWCAVSKERGNSPIEWAKQNVGKRWQFNRPQSELIFDTLNRLWRY
jgi:hypothetical protein